MTCENKALPFVELKNPSDATFFFILSGPVLVILLMRNLNPCGYILLVA